MRFNNLGLLLFFAAQQLASAAVLHVHVADGDGRAISDAVVIATASDVTAVPHTSATAVMDQVNKAFVPEVLVVRTGTSVVFPNTDSVAHQVYSFSPAKRFELPLYRGQPHAPVMFDRPGLVVVGCNIHDSMVGYIYVTDSPNFAMTDKTGAAVIGSLAAGHYRLTVWSSRLATQPAEQSISVADPDTTVQVRAAERARARNDIPAPRRLRDY